MPTYVKVLFAVLFVISIFVSSDSKNQDTISRTEAIKTEVVQDILQDTTKAQKIGDSVIKLNLKINLSDFDTLRIDSTTLLVMPKGLLKSIKK